MLAQVAGVIEGARLQIGAIGGDLGKGGFGQDLLGDIVDRAVHLAPGDLGIHDGFAAAASIITTKYCMGRRMPRGETLLFRQVHYFRKPE